MSQDPTMPLPDRSTGWQTSPPAQRYPVARRRRKRWPLITGVIVVVIVILLVASDRVANALAENEMASQVQSSLSLSGKPNVSIGGFPFWTQLFAHDFKTVNVSADNETTGSLTIARLNATLNGMHFQSLSSKSATVDNLTANALITFTALGNAGGLPQGVTFTADGPNQVKASIDVAGFSDSVTARVVQSGPNQIRVHVLDAGGIPSDILGSLGNFSDFTVSIPKLPAGVSISSVSVTQQGVQVMISGHNTTLSQ
jgi:hypothetical protein